MLPLNNDPWEACSFSHNHGSVEHYAKWKETTSWRDPFLTEPCLSKVRVYIYIYLNIYIYIILSVLKWSLRVGPLPGPGRAHLFCLASQVPQHKHVIWLHVNLAPTATLPAAPAGHRILRCLFKGVGEIVITTGGGVESRIFRWNQYWFYVTLKFKQLKERPR